MKVLSVFFSILLLVLLAFSQPVSAIPITVTNHNDSGAGSLRDAIASANPGDTILFSLPSPDTILLSSGELFINKNLIITGPGPSALFIDGQLLNRVFHIDFGVSAVISGLTVQHGKDSTGFGGGGILNQSDLTLDNVAVNANSTTSAGGGGIRSVDTLSISNSVIDGNSCPTATGGGGIQNSGDLTMDQVTVSGNTSGGGGGGIAHASAVASIKNSTISGNTVNNNNGAGGGIASSNVGASLILVNVTVSGNQVVGTSGFGGGISDNNDSVASLTNVTIANNSAANGGGIGNFNTSDTTIVNSIIADSVAGGDCNKVSVLDVVTDGGNNIVEDNSCGFTGGSDPLLGTLNDNGGFTETQALLSGSPAINQGNNAACLSTDQRGIGRQGTCDIGAYEFIATPGSVQFSAAAYQVSEDGGSLQVTITRTGGGDGAVSVTFSTSDGTATAGLDYTAVSQTVSFADGDMANQVVSVPVSEDTAIDPDETINLALSNPQGGVALGNPNTAIATILDVANVPPSAEDCDNRIDDDGDGDVDCNDSDCDSNPICQGIGGGNGNGNGGCTLGSTAHFSPTFSTGVLILLAAGWLGRLRFQRGLAKRH